MKKLAKLLILIGVFMFFGAIGGLENETMTMTQFILFLGIGVISLCFGIKNIEYVIQDYEDEDLYDIYGNPESSLIAQSCISLNKENKGNRRGA